VLDVDKDRLRSAPGFDQSNFPDVNDPKWSSENRKYFPQANATGSTGAAATGTQRSTDAATGSAGRGGSTASDVGTSGATTGRSGTAAGTGANADRATTGSPNYGTDVDKDRMKAGTSGTGATGTPRSENRQQTPGSSNTTGNPVTNQPGTAGGVGNPPATGGGTGTK
jgi:hypothetical protein